MDEFGAVLCEHALRNCLRAGRCRELDLCEARWCMFREKLVRLGSLGKLCEKTSTRPVGRCPTAVYGDYRSIAVRALAAQSPDLLGRAERSSPMPHRGAPEGAGLTAKARTERSSMSPQCASSSDTVREIKYQILQIMQTASPSSLAQAATPPPLRRFGDSSAKN
jgi:hypothetical protein